MSNQHLQGSENLIQEVFKNGNDVFLVLIVPDTSQRAGGLSTGERPRFAHIKVIVAGARRVTIHNRLHGSSYRRSIDNAYATHDFGVYSHKPV